MVIMSKMPTPKEERDELVKRRVFIIEALDYAAMLEKK